MARYRIVAIIDGQSCDLGVPESRLRNLDEASRIAVELGAEMGLAVIVEEVAPPPPRQETRAA